MHLKVHDLNMKSTMSWLAKATALNVGRKVSLLMLVAACWLQGAQAQGWEATFGGISDDEAYSVLQTPDHGYIIVGTSESFGDDNDFDVYVVRVNVDGALIWQQIYDEAIRERGYQIIESADGNYLIIGDLQDNPATPNVFYTYLLKITPQGEFLWSRRYGTAGVDEKGFGIAKAIGSEGYAIIGTTKATSNGINDIQLIRVDENGDVLWRRTYGGTADEQGRAIVAMPDGGFAFTGNIKQGLNTDMVTMRVNSLGDVIWADTIVGPGGDEARSITRTQNGDLAIAGFVQNSALGYVHRYNADGGTRWSKEISSGAGLQLQDIVESPDGALVATGLVEVNAVNIDIYLIKMDGENGQTIWAHQIGNNPREDAGLSVINTVDGGYAIAGRASAEGGEIIFIPDVVLVKVDASGNTITNKIQGRVFRPVSTCNPVFAIGDAVLPAWIVRAESSTGQQYYGVTDATGRYSILTDTGSYTVTLLAPNNYWDVCNNDRQVALNQFYANVAVNFAVEPETECPYLEVDVSATFLAVCSNVSYNISYCNVGPVTANEAYVVVTLDDELTYTGVSPGFTATEIAPRTYRVELGDIGSTVCGSFYLYGAIACEGIANGQAGLVSAHIFPDSICQEPDPNWDGASIIVKGECIDDLVKFQIKNVGDGDMIQARNYFVVEDQILFLNEPFILPSQDSVTIELPITGATYRIIAEQAVGHPGAAFPTLALEGCADEGGNYTTGNVTQFPENDQDPFISIDVQEITTSEPQATLLRGYPTGYADSVITAETDLIYTIFFANLGVDTIEQWIIRDTIPSSLDITTVMPGASSHPYEFSLSNDGVLRFIFSEIQLFPGSSTADDSHRGFVKFRISQQSNNPLGTLIENRAAVFFDYQTPVNTNAVRHTVGCIDFFDPTEGCITVDVAPVPNAPDFKIKVFPNPFWDYATIEIENLPSTSAQFELYDALGRLLRSEQFNYEGLHRVYRNGLPAGLYFFKLRSEGQLIGNGKMVVR